MSMEEYWNIKTNSSNRAEPVYLHTHDDSNAPLESDLIRALTVYDSQRLYNTLLRCPPETRDRLEGILYAIAQEHNAQYPEV